MFRGEDALIRCTFTRQPGWDDLAGPVFVAVEVVNPNGIEIAQQGLAHHWMRPPDQER